MSNKRKFGNLSEYINEKKKEQWLIHIKTDRETPGFVTDITGFKIYYDSAEGNYRRKLQCECGAPLGCFCFGSLAAALESIDNTLAICDRCYLKDSECAFVEDTLANIYPNRDVNQLNDIEVKRIMQIVSQYVDHDNDFDMSMCGI